MENVELKTIGNFSDCMTRKQTAKYLNICLMSFDTLVAQSKSGQLKPPLPALRLRAGGRAFYSKEQINKWLELRLLKCK